MLHGSTQWVPTNAGKWILTSGLSFCASEDSSVVHAIDMGDVSGDVLGFLEDFLGDLLGDDLDDGLDDGLATGEDGLVPVIGVPTVTVVTIL